MLHAEGMQCRWAAVQAEGLRWDTGAELRKGVGFGTAKEEQKWDKPRREWGSLPLGGSPPLGGSLRGVASSTQGL